jgi:hypothetical protein
MFQLSEHATKLVSVNPRAEKHGQENEPAMDLKLEVAAHSSLLNHFDAALRPLLFRKADVAGDQPSLIEGDDLTAIRSPQLGTIAWAEKFPGYELEVHAGLPSGKSIVLKEIELSKFRFEPINGGSVKVTFSVICHPDAKAAGALCQLVQEQVDISLRPPEVEQRQADLADQGADDAEQED